MSAASFAQRALVVAAVLASGLAACAQALPPDGEHGVDFVVPAPAPGEGVAFALISATPRFAPQHFYVNLDGVIIAPGGWSDDNAQTNTSFITDVPLTLPAFEHAPWGGDREAVVAELMAGLNEDFAAFQVTFSTERPASGDYTMVVVGGRAGRRRSQRHGCGAAG